MGLRGHKTGMGDVGSAEPMVCTHANLAARAGRGEPICIHTALLARARARERRSRGPRVDTSFPRVSREALKTSSKWPCHGPRPGATHMHPRRRAACVVLGIDLDLNTGRARGVRGHPQWAREVCKVSRTPHGKPNACHCTREADHEVETRGIAWAPAEAKSVPIHRTADSRLIPFPRI